MTHLVTIKQLKHGTADLNCKIIKQYETSITPSVGDDIEINDLIVPIRRVVIKALEYPPQEGQDPLEIFVFVNLPISPITEGNVF